MRNRVLTGLTMMTVGLLIAGCGEKDVPNEARYCSDVLGAQYQFLRKPLPTITDFTGPSPTGTQGINQYVLTYYLDDQAATQTGTCEVKTSGDKVLLHRYQLTATSGYVNSNPNMKMTLKIVEMGGHLAHWRMEGYEELEPYLPGTGIP